MSIDMLKINQIFNVIEEGVESYLGVGMEVERGRRILILFLKF